MYSVTLQSPVESKYYVYYIIIYICSIGDGDKMNFLYLKAIKKCLRTRQWHCNLRPHIGCDDKENTAVFLYFNFSCFCFWMTKIFYVIITLIIS